MPETCAGSLGEAVDVPRKEWGAGNETRTRDPDLGKVVLYQLSYSRTRSADSMYTP